MPGDPPINGDHIIGIPLTFGSESRNLISTVERGPDHQLLNLAGAIGAAESASIECLTFYIPSRDKDGNDFDQIPWIEQALALLSQIGGGATVLPPAEGAWLNPETGTLIRENVVLAYT